MGIAIAFRTSVLVFYSVSAISSHNGQGMIRHPLIRFVHRDGVEITWNALIDTLYLKYKV